MSSGGTTWSFTYDANGMRTSRTNGTTTYSYVYNGGQLSRMTIGPAIDATTENTITLDFTYDAYGTPLSVNYNGTYYYYVTDLQGDVVAIVDTEGEKVVEYLYDAWGRLLTTGGTKAADLGLHNPLRYRGYVYDTESGLYYLQSRYYNPELGRFINADAFASTGQGILGNNMFAYCLNNGVSNSDYTGNIPCNAFYVATHDFGSGRNSERDKSIVQKILEHVTATNEDNTTFSVGGTAAASYFGYGIGGTLGVGVDSSYNYAGIGSANYGFGSSLGASAMAGINLQFTNADIVTDLGGVSKSYGFTLAALVGISVDVVQFVPASSPDSTCWGVSVTIGFGIGADVHASQSNTTVSETWNPWKELCDLLFGG